MWADLIEYDDGKCAIARKADVLLQHHLDDEVSPASTTVYKLERSA